LNLKICITYLPESAGVTTAVLSLADESEKKIMSLRFHEIAEINHRILNPFTEDQLMFLGEVCRLNPETR
jgi:hypothetical protein